MGSKTQTNTRRHIDDVMPGGFSDDTLKEWYINYQPVGPLADTMRNICALIEEIASTRNIELPPVHGLKKGKSKDFMTPLEREIRKMVGEQVGLDPYIFELHKQFYQYDLDSLDMVEIIMVLEDEFDLEIDEETGMALDTLEKCIIYVQNHASPENLARVSSVSSVK